MWNKYPRTSNTEGICNPFSYAEARCLWTQNDIRELYRLYHQAESRQLEVTHIECDSEELLYWSSEQVAAGERKMQMF